MPSGWTMLVFVGAVAVLAITPGPDILYVLTRGMTQGPRAGFIAALGFSTGCIGHTIFAVAGLTAVLKASAAAFMFIKLAGAGYLVFLGIRTWLDHSGLEVGGPRRMQEMGAIFRQSVLANLLNPKVAVFFLAFLPQFVDVERGPGWLQLLVFGGLFTAVTIVVFGAVGFASGSVGRWLGGRASVRKAIRYAAGTILVGLGLRLAWARP